MMIISDGGRPSNIDRGYVLRRLIRRMIRHLNKLEIDLNELSTLIDTNVDNLKEMYPELEKNRDIIKTVILEEKDKFVKTLVHGERKFQKEIKKLGDNKKIPGLADQSENTIAYHTATHLLNAALKVVLGPDTHQRGSNITAERMRFDFNCDHKLTDEEKQKTEELVNKWIKEELPVTVETMKKEDAVKLGAECMFIEKYPDEVTVYSIGDVSKELCGGPHVKNTRELGRFKIKKEESSSSGVRRIKAVLIKE